MIAAIRDWPLQFWREEIRPVTASLSPLGSWLILLATALLLNKRYLADRSYGGPADQRWYLVAVWLLVLLVVIGLASRARSPYRGAAQATIGGLVALLGLMALQPGEGGWRLVNPFTLSATAMLLLVVVPLALATPRVVTPARRPLAMLLATVVTVALVLTVLSGIGPCHLLLRDYRYDKLNWFALTALWLLVAPLAASWGTLGGGLAESGAGLGRWRFWAPLTAVLAGFMVVVIVRYAGAQPEFLAYYPMFRRDWPGYDPAHNGWGFFWVYQSFHGLYFLAWEFFFRGWMLFRLGQVHGAAAIWLQTVPFVLMHLGKPGVELHSSLIAGVVLGWLAWRGRSFWPCFLLHWCAAFTMDWVAITRTAGGGW